MKVVGELKLVCLFFFGFCSYGVMKRRFPILALGMRYPNLDVVRNIIKSCCILHNIAIDAKDMMPTEFAPGFFEAMQQSEMNCTYQFRRTGQQTIRDVLIDTYFKPMHANALAHGDLEDAELQM